MELSEFVTNTLVDITNGVIEAKKQLKDKGVLINPTMKNNLISDEGYKQIQLIEMNVAISIEDKDETRKGAGIKKVLSVGFEKSDSGVNKYATSIKFSIPISLPADGIIQKPKTLAQIADMF